jgi:hypothetical protein
VAASVSCLASIGGPGRYSIFLVDLFVPKIKLRERELRAVNVPLDTWLSRLHLELPYMQNVLAHGTPLRSGVVAGSLIRFLNISERPTLRRQPRNAVQPPRKITGSPPASSWALTYLKVKVFSQFQIIVI